MSQSYPTVSVVIPAFNSAHLLPACIAAIKDQDYPGELVDIVIADGGSTDGTQAMARALGARVVDNPLRTGEAGKALGVRASSGELVALVDTDNILEGPGWLKRMVEPFQDPEIEAAEPIRFTWRRQDPPLTRYCALMGLNDPLTHYVGNYDRECLITRKWTGLRLKQELRPGYIKVRLEGPSLPTMGANGFVATRSLLAPVADREYLFDIDVLAERALTRPVHVAKVDIGIVHLYAKDLRGFAKKQRRRVVDYSHFEARGLRSYDWKVGKRIGIARFVAATLLVFPLLWTSLRGFVRKRDSAWWLHAPMCWITLWVYGTAIINGLLSSKRVLAKERPVTWGR